MIERAAWVVDGRWFDRRSGDPPLHLARWSWVLSLAVAVRALVPATARSDAPARPDAATEKPGDPSQADGAKASLPPRALLRIGTDDLRLNDDTRAFAFSSDGRLIAVADANARSPLVVMLDVRTGRQAKQIIAQGKREGGVGSFAFSPDGAKLLWAEHSGEVALWKIQCNHLLFCEERIISWMQKTFDKWR
jgi:hypothetical protein